MQEHLTQKREALTALHTISICIMASTTSTKLKVALFGLGRLGAIRADILVNLQPDIELVAASDPKPGADQWAAQNLPPTVKFFADPVECLEKGGADAVLISTATATHAPLVLKALDLGLVSPFESPSK